MREDARDAAARVNEQRLWQRHAEMAAIGAIPGNGVNRPALSPEDIQARKLLLSWATARNFTISADGIGNLFVRRPGTDANADPVLTGSHMDSQPRGGRFDGIYGVLAGFEALEAMDEAGVITRRPVEVVAWTNEEGGRFSPCTMGSMVFSGARSLADVLDVTDNEGTRLRDALAQTLAATPQAAQRAFKSPAAAYIALHEFHPEALSAPLLLLMIYSRSVRRLWLHWLCFAGVLSCKENMALLLGAYCCVFLFIERRKERGELIRWFAAPLLLAPARHPQGTGRAVSGAVPVEEPDGDD